MESKWDIRKMKATFMLGFIGSWCLSFLMSTSLSLADDIFSKVISAIIVTVMQVFTFYFLRRGYKLMAITFLLISILGNVTFWYNQNAAYMDQKLKGSSEIQSIKEGNSLKETFINLAAATKKETANDYDESISDNKSKIEELKQEKITATKETKSNIIAYNKKKGVGSWHKGQEKIRLNNLLDSKLKALDSKIEILEGNISTLRQSKINDKNKTTSDVKEAAASFQNIDYSQTSDSIVYSEGYLGIASELGKMIDVRPMLIIFIVVAFIGTSFEIGLVRAKMMLLDLLNNATPPIKKSSKFQNVIAKGKMLAKRKAPKDTVTATLTTNGETVELSSPEATAVVTGQTEFYPHEEAKKPKKEYKTRKIGFSQGSTLDKATKEYMRFILTNIKPDGTLLGITNLEKVCKKQGLTNTRGTWDTMKKLNIIEKVNGSMVINQDMVNKWL